jgi:hypothetical protein
MARRSTIVAMVAAFAAIWPVSSFAAVAPAAAPVLTSVPYTLPSFTWTPGVSDPLTPLTPNTWQTVERTDGACPPAATSIPVVIGTFHDNTTSAASDSPADGVYCYFIRTDDDVTVLTSTGPTSPGLTVAVDTQSPLASVVVTPVAGGIVTGTVAITGTESDAVSGVGSATFHVGAPGTCATGASIGASWDTTTVANGSYDVCNVVIDNAGHEQVAVQSVTVANPVASPTPPPASTGSTGNTPISPASIPPSTVDSGPDRVAPKAPTKVAVVLPRVKVSSGNVAVQLHWTNPKATDLDRIVVVLNLKHAPRSPSDGTKIYKGLGTSASVRLRAGGTGYVALFAYDHAGNISSPAQKTVSLAPLIPLRPFTGSIVTASPRLTWTATKGAAYYNVQVFHSGTRVFSVWPTQPAFSITPGKLGNPGTYVWFVWPAFRHGSAAPTFGKLIGRATFVYQAA